MKKAEEANAYYNKQPGKMNTYEASEGVKDMPIKQTEESHKKCSPGEFGMHKGGNDNAALLALLKQWEANGGGQSAYPMSANASPMKPLPPELAAALQAHMKLPAKMQPDELDAAETMMNLEGTLGGPKPAAGPMGKAGAFTFGQKLANDMLKGVQDFGKTYMHYTQSNPVWNAGRAVARSVDAFTDPKNHEHPFQAASNAALGKPAPTPSSAPVNGDYTQSNPVWNGLRAAGRAIDTFTDPRNAAGPAQQNSIFNKAGAFTFGQKLANDWMGFNYKNVGPGGLISTRTLPKADATAKSWGPAQPPVPPPSAATRVAVPNSPQQYNDIFQAHPGLKQISPNMQQNMRSRISQGGDYNVQPAAKTLSPASFGKNIFNKLQ